MKLIYSILCSDIITDRESGSTSYLKAIDEVVISQLPVMIPNVHIGTYWDMSDHIGKKFFLRFKIVTPDGKKASVDTKVPIEIINKKHRHNLRLAAFPLEIEGIYRISIEAKLGKSGRWSKKNEIMLPVEIDESIIPKIKGIHPPQKKPRKIPNKKKPTS